MVAEYLRASELTRHNAYNVEIKSWVRILVNPDLEVNWFTLRPNWAYLLDVDMTHSYLHQVGLDQLKKSYPLTIDVYAKFSLTCHTAPRNFLCFIQSKQFGRKTRAESASSTRP